MIKVETADDLRRYFNVSRETMIRLERYEALLGRWQKKVNLVSDATLSQFWSRHVEDSVQLLNIVSEKAKKWIDLGSGGGFPALVIAQFWAEQEDKEIHLVESDARKCAFLRMVARETGVKVKIHEMRIEGVIKEVDNIKFDVISARALAPLNKLLGLSAPLFCKNTRAFFLKGKRWQEELTVAKQYWKVDYELVNSMISSEGKVLVLKKPERINNM